MFYILYNTQNYSHMIIISNKSKFITESILSKQTKDDIMDSVKKLINLSDANTEYKYILLYSKELGVGFCSLYHYMDLDLLKEHTEKNMKIISSINIEATTIMLSALDQSNFPTKWSIKSNNHNAVEKYQLLNDINNSTITSNLFVEGEFIMLNSRDLYRYFNIVPSLKTLFNPDRYIAEVMVHCTKIVFDTSPAMMKQHTSIAIRNLLTSAGIALPTDEEIDIEDINFELEDEPIHSSNHPQQKQNSTHNTYEVNYVPNMFNMDDDGSNNGSMFEQMLDELDITSQKYIMTLTNKLVRNEELLVLSKDKSKALLLVVPPTQNGVDYNSILLNELEGYMVAWEQYELAGKLKNLK